MRRWNPDTHTFEATDWPAALGEWRARFEQELSDFTAGRPPTRRGPFRGDDSIIVTPLRNLVSPRSPAPVPQTVTPVFGFTIIQLNMAYLREQMLPELAERHFIHAEGDVYRVSVTNSDDPSKVLYQSDPGAPVERTNADATAGLLGRVDPVILLRSPSASWRRRPRSTAWSSATHGRDAGWTESAGARIRSAAGCCSSSIRADRSKRLWPPRDAGIWASASAYCLLLTVSIGLLVNTSRRAQRLARQQMEFVAGVSHELRTPVAVIRSASENLAHGVVTGDRVKSYGQLLQTEAKRLGEMVERVLQYAGSSPASATPLAWPCHPPRSSRAPSTARCHCSRPSDVQIHREIAADLPQVLGDAAALRSAVQNLIANAVKYGGRDRWVGIRAEHARDRRRSEVRITVSDHGAGIPASELPHIFDPFYRGADAVERQMHGNGLGLSLVKRIVAAHGGRVSVTTRAGAGSSFTIALPAVPPRRVRALSPNFSR